MSMLWRSWIALVAVLATVLAIMGLLSVLQYDAVLTRLIQERLAVIAETSASPFRAVINLGLPIATVRNAGSILKRSMEVDPAVAEIQVFHQSGIVVHTTQSRRRDPVPRSILQAQARSAGDRWTATSDGRLLAGLTLRSLTGEPVGGIAVSATSADFDKKSKAMRVVIAIAAGVVFAIFSVMAFVVLRLRLDGVVRGLGNLERLSDRFVDDAPPGRESGPPDTGARSGGLLAREIATLEELLGAAFRNFATAQRELGRLSPVAEGGRGERAPRVRFERTELATVPATSLARSLARSLTPWIGAIILGATLALGLVVHGEVTRSFEPELAARTRLIGEVANRNVQRAVDAGVPLENLVGAENYFVDLLRHFPEVSYFGIATGRIVYEAGTRQRSLFGPERSRKDLPTYPITASGEQIGYVIIDANAKYFALQFRDMLLDFGVVVLVVLLFAVQVMTLVLSRSLTAPLMRLQHLAGLQAASDFSKVIVSTGRTAIDSLIQRLSGHAIRVHEAFNAVASLPHAGAGPAGVRALAARFNLVGTWPDQLRFSYLNDVRLPLFLFAAADELPLAFFPLFTKAADNPLSWLDPGIVISLPLAGYLLAIVFGSPLARPLAERLGHRRLLLLAAAPTLVGHLGLYAASNVVEIVAFRTLTGLGYAVVTLTCQDYVLDAVHPAERNRSLSLFTAAMFSGIFAGAALGGVLADRLGQHTVFVVCAGLVLVSGLLTWRLLPHRPQGGATAKGEGGFRLPPVWQPLRSRQFQALVFGIAIPANIVVQAFISFLVALELNALGASAADVGRILMTYFVAIVFVGPAVPYMFEGRLGPSSVVLAGAVISGTCLYAVVVSPGLWTMLIAVAGAGVGHSMVRDTQVAVAMGIAEGELADMGATTVLGSLRTLERLGSIVGLLLVAAISTHVGYRSAIGIVAAVVLVGAAGYAVSSARRRVTSSRSRQTGGLPPADRD